MKGCLDRSTGVLPSTTPLMERWSPYEPSSEEESQPTLSWAKKLGSKEPRISRDISSSVPDVRSVQLRALAGLPDPILRHAEEVLLKLGIIVAKMDNSRSSVSFRKAKGIEPISIRLFQNFEMDHVLKRLRLDIRKFTAGIAMDCETLLSGLAVARGGSQLSIGSGDPRVQGNHGTLTPWTRDLCGRTVVMDGLTDILGKMSRFLTTFAMIKERVKLFPSELFLSFWIDTPYKYLSKGVSSSGIQEELFSLQTDLCTICSKMCLLLSEKRSGEGLIA